MRNGKKTLMLLLLVMIAGTATLTLCGNNPLHETQAAGMLTMQQCLRCHGDGVMMTKTITVCVGKECLYTKDHSVMHRYPPAGKERRYATVKEIEQAGCILENGKVTCLSCHDLTKPPPHTIREGDKLCLICHIDKTSR